MAIRTLFRTFFVAGALLGSVTAGYSLRADGTPHVWIGTEDGDMLWSNPDNWDPAGVPTGTDTAIFRPTGAITVKFNTTGTAYPQTLRFESGATSWGLDGVTWAYNGFGDNPTGYVYVAEGAAFTNNLARYEKKGTVLVKQGAGVWKHGRHICWDSGTGGPASLRVEGGSFLLTGESPYAKLSEITVAEGAFCFIDSYNTISGTPRCHVDGTLRLNSSENNLAISSLSGMGVIEDVKYRSKVTVSPAVDCTFSGAVNERVVFVVGEGEGVFRVGAADTLNSARNGVLVKSGASFGFAPGIGTFRMLNGLTVEAGQTVTLADADGEPVTVETYPTTSADGAFSGPGSIQFTRNYTALGNAYANTGLLFTSNATGEITLTLGDGTAANDPTELVATLGSWGKSKVAFKTGEPFELKQPLVGSGLVEVKAGSAKVTVDDIRKTGGTVYLSSPLEVAGGDSAYEFTGFSLSTDAAVLTVSGGIHGFGRRTVAETSLSPSYWFRSQMLPGGLIFSSATTGSKVVQTGGVLTQGGTYNAAPMRYELEGGELRFTDSVQPSGKATVDKPSVYFFNGGVFAPTTTSKSGAGLSDGLFSAKRQDGSSSAGLLKTMLGPKGVHLSVAHTAAASQNYLFNRPLTADGDHTGGVTIDGEATYTFTEPVTMKGDLRVTDGGVMINESSDVATTPQFFGTGSLYLRNAAFSFWDCSTDKNLRLANASGQGVTYEAAGMIRFRRKQSPGSSTILDDQCSKQTLVTGPISRAGKGSVLYLWDGDAQLVGEAVGSKYTVVGGVEMNAAGTIRQPIVGARWESSWFLEYDETDGFRPYSRYAAMADETTKGSIVKTTAACTIAAGQEKTIGGLAISGGAVTVNGTLKIGNGTDPALVLLNRNSISGTGTVDFGTSEGIFCGSSWHTAGGSYRDSVTADIRGSGGVTVISAPDHFRPNRWVRFTGNNTFTGGLYVNSVHLMLDGANVLGADDVTVGGGKRYGGHLVFVTDGATYANSFHIAGYGIRDTLWDGYQNKGALEFRVNTTLTGDIELTERTRLVVPVADKTARLTGVVSGATLEMLHPDIAEAGKIVLENHNTYTGGTDLVRATLALVKGDGAGTGKVELDQAVLRFENTEPIVFTNEVEGVGTIVFAGSAPVTLSGKAFANLPFKTLAAGSSIDVANAANNLYVPAVAGDLDLGGQALTVAGLSGSGRVLNGSLTVNGAIRPGGAENVGTLALECAVAFASGASLVVEDDGEAIDALTVAGDADLAALALDYRVIGERRCRETHAVVTAASVTGEFASVTKTGRGATRATVEYAAGSARVNPNVGGVLLIIR